MRQPVRPLGALSDYCVNRLPANLAENKPKLILSQTETLAESINLEVLKPEELAVARLDVLLLDRALAHHFEEPGDNLGILVERLSALTGLPPFLTYEDLILNNPQTDIRTFTGGEIGASEADFVRIHFMTEQSFGRVIGNIKQAGFLLQNNFPETAVTILDEAGENLDEASALTLTVGQNMPKTHYDEFRPYLLTHPLKGTKGPSGAFSNSIPMIELLLAGEKLTSSSLEYLYANLDYFPGKGKLLMETARQAFAGHSLRTVVLSRYDKHERLWETCKQLEEKIRFWRGTHRRGVETQLPEAMRKPLIGTSGEPDVSNFLNDRLKNRLIED